MQQHFLTYDKDIAMLDGRKYEVFVEMQQYNWAIFCRDPFLMSS
jgi:hypothetical protein